MYRELLLGCGAKREKDLRLPSATQIQCLLGGFEYQPPDSNIETLWKNLTTLDINPDHEPDIVCDLERIGTGIPGYKIPADGSRQSFHCQDNTYDEIHAYEVLEHIGAQGDYKTFFAQFTEFHRILKPNGFFFATCPAWFSSWAWGDPSHTRVITAGTLAFLSQEQYRIQVGKTPMSDFRRIYQADFECVFVQEAGESLLFVLMAVK